MRNCEARGYQATGDGEYPDLSTVATYTSWQELASRLSGLLLS